MEIEESDSNGGDFAINDSFGLDMLLSTDPPQFEEADPFDDFDLESTFLYKQENCYSDYEIEPLYKSDFEENIVKEDNEENTEIYDSFVMPTAEEDEIKGSGEDEEVIEPEFDLKSLDIEKIAGPLTENEKGRYT
jgi:hypothetical protein